MGSRLRRGMCARLAVGAAVVVVPLLGAGSAQAAMGGALPLTSTFRPDLSSVTLVSSNTAQFCFDKTLGQSGEEGQHVLAAERLGDDHPPRSVNAMNLKNMLGQIEANSRDRRQIGDRLSHGRRSLRRLLNDNHLGTALNRARCRCGRRPPITSPLGLPSVTFSRNH